MGSYTPHFSFLLFCQVNSLLNLVHIILFLLFECLVFIPVLHSDGKQDGDGQ